MTPPAANAAEVAKVARPAQWDEWDRRIDQDLAAQRSSDWWRRLKEASAPARPKTAGSGMVWPDDNYANDPRYGNVYPPIQPPDLAEYAQREADYVDVCSALTGRSIPEKAYQTLRRRRIEMDAQTVSLARDLECHGDRFLYGDAQDNRCTVIGLFSGAVLPLPPVRRVAIFPSIAAQQRARMLRDIEYFVSCHPTTSRLFTITHGPRVLQTGLRQAVSAFHRKLSKWNAGEVFHRFRLRMQWRATEFGSFQWDPESGQPTWHVHAHVLVTEDRPLSRRQRKLCRKALWRLFQVNWDDAGTIENVREFVKYPVKPGDLDRLSDEGGSGAVFEFYQQTKGLHLCQPLSDLRRIRAVRKSKARRLVRLPVENEGSILVEKADWNAGHRPLKDQTARKRYLKRVAEIAQSVAQTTSKHTDSTDTHSATEWTETDTYRSGIDSHRTGIGPDWTESALERTATDSARSRIDADRTITDPAWTGTDPGRSENDDRWTNIGPARTGIGVNGPEIDAHSRRMGAQKGEERETNDIETGGIDIDSAEGPAETGGESGSGREETGGNRPESARKGPRPRNRIVARLAPAPYGGPIMEPAVVVWGFTGDLEAIRSDPRAAAIIAAHRPAWEAAQATRAYAYASARSARQGRVHKGQTTVRRARRISNPNSCFSAHPKCRQARLEVANTMKPPPSAFGIRCTRSGMGYGRTC